MRKLIWRGGSYLAERHRWVSGKGLLISCSSGCGTEPAAVLLGDEINSGVSTPATRPFVPEPDPSQLPASKVTETDPYRGSGPVTAEVMDRDNPAWHGKILIRTFEQDGTPKGWSLSSTSQTRAAAYYYLRDKARLTVSGGIAHAVHSPGPAAFDANGSTSCTGSPKVCTPLWGYATNFPVTSFPSGGYAAVDGNMPYVDALTLLPPGPLTVIAEKPEFDAHGVRSCSGTPTVCTQLWSTKILQRKPLVGEGSVFVPTALSTSGDHRNGLTWEAP
jgi:hypothetical protein